MLWNFDLTAKLQEKGTTKIGIPKPSALIQMVENDAIKEIGLSQILEFIPGGV